MTDLLAFSACALLARFAAKTLSPVELLDAVLERLEAAEPDVNACAFVDVEGAQRDAHASETRWQAGTPAGAADGLIATIKDNILAAGLPNRRGSRTTDNTPADVDRATTETALIRTRCGDAGVVVDE